MNIISLVKKIKSVNEGQIYNIFSTEAFLRIIAWYVTPIFYYTKCSPNTISYIALIIGLSSSLSIIYFGKFERSSVYPRDHPGSETEGSNFQRIRSRN